MWIGRSMSGTYGATIGHLSEAIADGNLSSHHLAAVMASRGTAYESKGEETQCIRDERGSGESCVYRGLAWVKKQAWERHDRRFGGSAA